jgi:hypothetical protein
LVSRLPFCSPLAISISSGIAAQANVERTLGFIFTRRRSTPCRSPR